MSKPFDEALKDSFNHVTQINDPETVAQLRAQGVLVDSEGYHALTFGDHNEYELAIEPIADEGNYQIAIYKNRVPLAEKLIIWIHNSK